MDVKNAVNHDVAMKQWESLKATIERCGASVEVLEPIVYASIYLYCSRLFLLSL